MKPTEKEVEIFRKSFGRSVAELRKRHDPPMTQFELAMASGARPEAVSRIERGVLDCGISYILRFSRALSVDMNELLDTAKYYGDEIIDVPEPLRVHEKPKK